MISDCIYLVSVGKNSSFLRVVQCRSLADEYSVDTVNRDEISKSEMFSLSHRAVQGCSLYISFVIELP